MICDEGGEPVDEGYAPPHRYHTMSMSATNVHKTVADESGSHVDDVIELYTDVDDGGNNEVPKRVLMKDDRTLKQRPSSARSRKSKSRRSTTRSFRSKKSTAASKTSDSNKTSPSDFNIPDSAEASTSRLNPLTENHGNGKAAYDDMTQDARRTLVPGSVERKTLADMEQSGGHQSTTLSDRKQQAKDKQTGKRKSEISAESEKTDLETVSEDVGEIEEECDEERPETTSSDSKSCIKSARKKRKRKSSASNAKAASRSSASTEQKKKSSPEFQLATSDNPEVKSWLRKKNRLLRKQLAEERRREKQQKKEEEERTKLNEKRNKESAETVAAWMRQKKLQQQEEERKFAVQMSRNIGGGSTVSGSTNVEKIAAAINSTLDQQISVRPIEVTVTSRTTPRAQGDATNSQISDATASLSVSNSRGRSRTGNGRIPSPRQSVSPARITLPQDDRYPTTQLAHSSNNPLSRSRPLPVPSATLPKSQPPANRVSYEVWLQRKQTEDEAKRKRRANEELQRQEARDNSTDVIVSSVARRRIDAILSGRRRVDTGIGRVDKEANSYPRIRSAVVTARSDDRLLTRRGSSRDQADLPLSTIDLNVERDNNACQRPEERHPEIENSIIPSKVAIQPSSSAVSMTSSFIEAAGHIDSSVQSGSTTMRPWSAFPARQFPRRVVVPAVERPSTADSIRQRQRSFQGVATSADSSSLTSTLDLTPTVTRLHAVAPRPTLPVTESSAYRSVQYQQRSWNGFADFVWDHVTESEGGDMVKTIEVPRSDGVTQSAVDTPRSTTMMKTVQDAERPISKAIGTATGGVKVEKSIRPTMTQHESVFQVTERNENTLQDRTCDSSRNVVDTSGSCGIEDVEAVAAATCAEITTMDGLLVNKHLDESSTRSSVAWAEPLSVKAPRQDVPQLRSSTFVPSEVLMAISEENRRPSNVDVADGADKRSSRLRRRLLLAQKIVPRGSTDLQPQTSSGELIVTPHRYDEDNNKSTTSSPEHCGNNIEVKDENAHIVAKLKTAVRSGHEDGELPTRSDLKVKRVSFNEMTSPSDDDQNSGPGITVDDLPFPSVDRPLSSRQSNEEDQLFDTIASNDNGTSPNVAVVDESDDSEDVAVRSLPTDEHHQDETVAPPTNDDDVTRDADDIDECGELSSSLVTSQFIPRVILNDGDPYELVVNDQ